MPQSVVGEGKTTADVLQVIGQAEIFPILVAKLTWAEGLKGKRLLVFIDNESARLALVKSYSPVLASLKMVMEVAMWDYRHEVDSWYARVPTCANISDCVSRMSPDGLQCLGEVQCVTPRFPGVQPVEFL